MLTKKIEEMAASHTKTCEELAKRVKAAHEMLNKKQRWFLVQVEKMYALKQSEIFGYELDHDNDEDELFEDKLEVLDFNVHETLAGALGFCLFQVCADAPLSFFKQDEGAEYGDWW